MTLHYFIEHSRYAQIAGKDLQSHILFIPRNYTLNNTESVSWTTKYATLGINAFTQPYYVDGVNEKGLAGGLFYFPGFAQYEDIPQDQLNKSLPMWQLLTWILTNFSSVCAVKQAVQTIHVSKIPFPELNEIVPAHLIIHDTLGNSLVIEYIDGQLHMHDNPLGVITNSPNFDWHLTNLRNYINLSPINSAPKKFGSLDFAQLGQGSGMLGLPGDFTSPSRFIRATAFQQAAPLLSQELSTVKQAFHILNNFDIPYGSVRAQDGTIEYTTWTSAIDLHNKALYWRTYDNFQLQKVSLLDLNLDAKEIAMLPMPHAEEIIDATQLLKALPYKQ